MADRPAPYDQRRPWTVPDSLEELTGPTSGVVELPVHLDWSEQRRYDLADPAQLGLMYERVIREAMRPEDLRRYLHGPTLRAVWRHIFLPRPVQAPDVAFAVYDLSPAEATAMREALKRWADSVG